MSRFAGAVRFKYARAFNSLLSCTHDANFSFLRIKKKARVELFEAAVVAVSHLENNLVKITLAKPANVCKLLSTIFFVFCCFENPAGLAIAPFRATCLSFSHLDSVRDWNCVFVNACVSCATSSLFERVRGQTTPRLDALPPSRFACVLCACHSPICLLQRK